MRLPHLFLLAALAAAACDDGRDPAVPGPSRRDAAVAIDASGADASALDAAEPADAGATDSGCATHVRLTDVVNTTFQSCGGRGPMTCHARVPFDDGLDLTETGAYASLVGVRSRRSPELRVVPGDVEHSFLWKKLNNILPEDGSQGLPMPKGEAIMWRPLPMEELEAVRCWIAEGAPND